MAAANKPPAAFLSTIAKKTSSSSREAAAILSKHEQGHRLPINTSATSSRMISNSPNATTWTPYSHNNATLILARQHQFLASQKRFQSTSPKNNNTSNKYGNNNTFTTLSTLAHFLAAGTGTFASTLLALYLATVVETSAHEFLHEHFPHWYDEVPLEELPTCLKNRVIALRRVVGTVTTEVSPLVGELLEGEGHVDDFGLMSMDGWIMEHSSTSLLNNELLAELEFEEKRQHGAEDLVATATTVTSAWQRKMTEKRADIIEQEEQDFSRGFLQPSSDGASAAESFSSSAKNGLVETKYIHEEAARKLRERLMSVAMTA